MTKIKGNYIGNLKVELNHLDSGSKIITSAPKDNNGDGLNFSPTDLVAGALGSCMLTIVGIIAQKKRLDISGSFYEVEKIMSKEPRRIGKLPLTIHLPSKLSSEERVSLEKYALDCPVHHSLHPDIESEINFVYVVV